jgi:hypothetical protein
MTSCLQAASGPRDNQRAEKASQLCSRIAAQLDSGRDCFSVIAGELYPVCFLPHFGPAAPPPRFIFCGRFCRYPGTVSASSSTSHIGRHFLIRFPCSHALDRVRLRLFLGGVQSKRAMMPDASGLTTENRDAHEESRHTSQCISKVLTLLRVYRRPVYRSSRSLSSLASIEGPTGCLSVRTLRTLFYRKAGLPVSSDRWSH